MKRSVALITHEMSLVGGLATMVKFLYEALHESGRFEPSLISLATSASDSASLRILHPTTWLKGPRIEHVPWNGLTFTHIGANGTELEFQRYRKRRAVRELYRRYDLLQFIVGSPPWVVTAEDAGKPIFLWTATTTRADRESRHREGSLARRCWSSMMIPMAERYERRGIAAAQKVFVLSEYTRAAVRDINRTVDITLAPCGVDTNLFRPSNESPDNYILCVARFSDARKNVQLLFEAYASLTRRCSNVPSLVLVGDPPTDAALTQLQRLGIVDRVKLVGPKSGEELASLFRKAQFFALSSNEEGLGIVILEAMASGLPVVSTACGGPETTVEEGCTGFLIPVGDTVALSAAMEKLITDSSLRARMGRAGRAAAVQRFSITATNKKFLDAYDEVLGETSTSQDLVKGAEVLHSPTETLGLESGASS